MNFKKLLAIICMALCMTMVFAGGASESSAEYTLMFAHSLTENDPWHQAALNWAQAVEERTNGAVHIDVYPNSQLGSEEDVIEQIQNTGL